MKTFLFLLFSLVFVVPSSKDIPIENLYDNFVRVEINMSSFHSLKLFEDGLLCKSANTENELTFDFYPLKDLNFKKFKEVQDYLHDNNFFEMNSVYEESSVVNHTHQIDLMFLNNRNIKRIRWTGGEYKHLQKILSLINDLVPKEKKKVYSIMPSWVKK